MNTKYLSSRLSKQSEFYQMEMRKKQLQFLYQIIKTTTLIMLYIYIVHPFDKW